MTEDYFKSLLNPGFISVPSKDEQIEQLKKENAQLKEKIALLEDEYADRKRRDVLRKKK